MDRAIPVALFVTFALVSSQKLIDWVSQGLVGIDLRIYRAAAQAALEGRNPWGDIGHAYHFAAPPPSLIAFLPAALIPEDVATVLYVLAMASVVLIGLRALGLPSWWLLFPPISESLLSINPDALILVAAAGAPALAGAAVAVKIYGVVPLLVGRRWTAVAVGCGYVLLSLPLWPMFLGSLNLVATRLSAETAGLSAWGTWLAIPALGALLLLRRHGFEWLIVPALWPNSQLHYSVIATPAARRSPLLAFLLSFSVPFLPAIAVIFEALRVVAVRFITEQPEHPMSSEG